MSTLSSACFVHKKKVSKGKSRISRSSPKKAVRSKNDLSDKRTDRLRRFETLWEDVLTAIESVQSKVYSEILEGCVRFVEKANERLVKDGCGEGEIPTAVLITGVNMPDHDVAFATLRELIRGSVSPFVVSLNSATDADSVKTAVQKVVATLISEDENATRKIKFTMPNLVAWYRNATSDASIASTSPRKSSRLSTSEQPSSISPSKRRKVEKTAPRKSPIVIVFEEFERILPDVARDFILICSEYSSQLPFIFVFGVSTSTTVVHKAVPQSALSKLAMETFQSRRSSDFLNIVVNEVLLNTKFPFKVSNRLFKFFEDVFLFDDLSVKTFVNGLKFSLMEYFYGNALSDLCCEAGDLDRRIGSLDERTLNQVRKLMSFRSFVDKLPPKEQKALLLDDNHLKETLRSKLEDLAEYHQGFFPVLRFLHSLCKSLPKSALGKQLRETYSLCLETDVGSSKEFAECTKMFRMMAKDELLDKVKSASMSPSSSPVLVSLKSDLEVVVHKLDELKGRNSEENALRQDLKDVSKTRKCPTAFELLRDELVTVIESYVTKYLRNYRSLVFHEIAYVDVYKTVKGELSGNHGGALRIALEDPGRYLKCECCSSTDGKENSESWPDVCVAHKLHAEYGRTVNLSDWLRSFNSIICPSDSDSEGSSNCEANEETIARFFHSVAELQFLGFVKPAARGKTDHVVRHTW